MKEQPKPEFKPVEVFVEKLGKPVIRFALMTKEEHDYWWEEGSEHPRFGTEMLGPDF